MLKCHKVSILGTPAEEEFGGKIDLLEAGVFDDVDAAMMAHPSSCTITHLEGYIARHGYV